MTDETNERTPDDGVLAMRALLRGRAAPQGDGAVPPETLRAFFAGELSAQRAQEVALAVVADPSLAEDVRVTAELGRAEGQASQAQLPARRSPMRLVWTAAAALAAAMLALWVLRPPAPTPSDSEVIRAGADASPIVSLVPPEGLPREAFDLRWSGGPQGATFDVQVTNDALVVVYQVFDLTDPNVRVPADRLGAVASGTELFWRVSATDASGRRASSAAFTVRVR